MPITGVDKVKIGKYLRETPIGEIYYIDLCDALGKRGKIKDIEFLDYFTNNVVETLRKDEKFSNKQLTKMISVVQSFLKWCHDEDSEISDETLDKIRSIKEYYDDYLTRTGFEKDEILYNEYILILKESIDELYPQEIKSESVSKYLNKIDELEKTIKKLEKELLEEEKSKLLLQDTTDKKNKKLEELREELLQTQKESNEKSKEIAKLGELVVALKQKVSILETSLQEITDENMSLKHIKDSYEKLVNEVELLRKQIEEDKKTKEKTKQEQERKTSLESIIFKHLIMERLSLDELIKEVKKEGIETSGREIGNIIRSMKKILTIDDLSFSTTPSYKIIQPSIIENSTFKVDVPFGCKHYDILLVSDFHIKDMDGKTLKGFETLNDYCTKFGINLVLNLGDFFDGHNNVINYENAVKNYKIVEKAISMIPQTDGIYHAVLGGNHEKGMSRCGFDPIMLLASERSDFINLGYTHSTISINSPINYLGSFDIHHPDDFGFKIYLGEDGIDIDEMNSYISDLYSKTGRSRDDSYIDIFGHTHRNQFNYPGGYCYIPSFFEGGNKKGACHLKIYFDEETDIKYMVFMPLTYNMNTKLTKTNEIVYQKVLKK